MSFGSWLKKNWATSLRTLGMTAFGAGYTGMVMHELNKKKCGCHSVFQGHNFFNYSSHDILAANHLKYYDMFSGMSVLNNTYENIYCNPNYGLTLAAEAGAQLGLQMAEQQAYLQQMSQSQVNSDIALNVLKKESYETASKVSETAGNVNEIGNAFNSGINKLVNGGEAIDGKKLDLDIENNSTYKQELSTLGKNYVDSISTDSDGYVNENEYIEHSLKDLPTNATKEDKKIAKEMAKTAFKKIDSNNDGKIDWKEMTATIATFDQKWDDTKKIKNGIIESEDMAKWSEALADSTSTTFDTAYKGNYKSLFDSD